MEEAAPTRPRRSRLVLRRKRYEGVWIGDVLVRVSETGSIVGLSIEAPPEVTIVRENEWRRERYG